MVRRLILPLGLLLGLAGCGGQDGGVLDVAFIDTAENMYASGIRLSEGAQHVRGATSSGLVALDARGDVIPALADRWIVTDDGLSFIFRLRDGTWPDGEQLTAESVRAALAENIRALDGTSLGFDLEPIEEVRAMAGRVVEIRLSAPVPMLLQLLAQPELAFVSDEGGAGDMTYVREGDVAVFNMKPPTERGIPEIENWRDGVRPVALQAMDARAAIDRFDDGGVDVVLGGRIGPLPLVETGPLSRGTVQIDPAIGLFGLQVRRARGFLATERDREAIAMAIDRAALIAPFNIAGWESTTRLVPPGLPGDPGLVAERWLDVSMEDRRLEAAARVADWRESQDITDEPVRLTILMGTEPGHDILLRELAGQLARVGIVLERAAEGAEPDLMMVDRVARYAAPRWFLNQFHCRLRRGVCSQEVDALVSEAEQATIPVERERLLAEAEARLTVANVYIPLGPPVRWSLVRGNVAGFAPNSWAFHPLPALATLPR